MRGLGGKDALEVRMAVVHHPTIKVRRRLSGFGGAWKDLKSVKSGGCSMAWRREVRLSRTTSRQAMACGIAMDMGRLHSLVVYVFV